MPVSHARDFNKPRWGEEKNSRKGREETFDHPVTVWLTTKKREQKKKDNPSFTTRDLERGNNLD